MHFLKNYRYSMKKLNHNYKFNTNKIVINILIMSFWSEHKRLRVFRHRQRAIEVAGVSVVQCADSGHHFGDRLLDLHHFLFRAINLATNARIHPTYKFCNICQFFANLKFYLDKWQSLFAHFRHILDRLVPSHSG